MNALENKLISLYQSPVPILDASIPMGSYVPIDLSTDNPHLKTLDITNPDICQSYIDEVLVECGGHIAYGGYMEKRDLYSDKVSFSNPTEASRNIHLGIDYWCQAHTKVLTPVNGTVHSFKNNSTVGDYGPTIILSHEVDSNLFYTLFGHLSLTSLEGLAVGKSFKQGEILGSLGTPDINVNYAPHLHFQIIRDIKDYFGDYPGVCSQETLSFYRENCPDPNLLLKIES